MLAKMMIGLVALLPVAVRADDYGQEIAAAHARRAGERLGELKAVYAEGRTLINDEVIPFRMWAERPNHLRIESGTEKRRVVQVYDGRHEPWLSHTDVDKGAPRAMTAAEAKDFVSNADFDGPLVGFAAKGFTVDYAGEDTVAGRKADKLLLMNAQDEVFFLWLDHETREVVKRAVFRIMRGERMLVETYFSDFRDVGGVKQPHRVETKIGTRSIYLMVISKMTANPELPADVFAPPVNWPEEKKDLAPLKFAVPEKKNE